MKSKLALFFLSSFVLGSSIQAKPQIVQSDIFYEISQGNKKAVKAWLTSKPDLLIRNMQGQTLLHAAVLSGNRDLVKILVKVGVHINALDAIGKTALDHAVEQKEVKITYDLVKRKALIACASNEKPLKDLIVKRMTRLYKIFAAVIAVGIIWIVGAFVVTHTLIAMHIIMRGWDTAFCALSVIAVGVVVAGIGIFEIAGLGVTSAVRTRKSYLLQN